MDAESYRAASRERWERAAAGWGAQRESMRAATAPVTAWLVVALRPEPGATVLELACGPGDTGFAVAEWLRPGGRLLATDGAEAMVRLARERAGALGLDDVVEVRELDAEHIDLPAASVDGVLCRWGYMLLADPGAALRETRRVLRPGGRVALAAWDKRDLNPWVTTLLDVLVERELAPPVDPDAPGMFAFAPAGRTRGFLEDAGFADIQVESLELTWTYDSFDDYWDTALDLGRPLAQLVAGLDEPRREEVRATVSERLAQFTGDDGGLTLPGRTLVAGATA
jgi:ubiquinone/menaquinone biosynthesis C-methylase UbiE